MTRGATKVGLLALMMVSAACVSTPNQAAQKAPPKQDRASKQVHVGTFSIHYPPANAATGWLSADNTNVEMWALGK